MNIHNDLLHDNEFQSTYIVYKSFHNNLFHVYFIGLYMYIKKCYSDH